MKAATKAAGIMIAVITKRLMFANLVAGCLPLREDKAEHKATIHPDTPNLGDVAST